MPAEGVDLLERDPLLAAVVVEEAELDPLGDLGEEREVGPGAVVGGAERVGRPGQVSMALLICG